jgi:hypothetical protein
MLILAVVLADTDCPDSCTKTLSFAHGTAHEIGFNDFQIIVSKRAKRKIQQVEIN